MPVTIINEEERGEAEGEWLLEPGRERLGLREGVRGRWDSPEVLR